MLVYWRVYPIINPLTIVKYPLNQWNIQFCSRRSPGHPTFRWPWWEAPRRCGSRASHVEKREKVTLYGSVSWECGECPGLPSYTHNTLYIYICMYVCMYTYRHTCVYIHIYIYIGGVSKIGKVGVSLIPHFKFDKWQILNTYNLLYIYIFYCIHIIYDLYNLYRYKYVYIYIYICRTKHRDGEKSY